MHYLLVLDSFKGTLSSYDAAESLRLGLGDGEIIPFSDGGEGFCDSFHYSLGGEYVFLPAVDSYGKPITTKYLRICDTAVIETALADGLVTVGGANKNIAKASSRGTGTAILRALEDGCKKIIIGFGGSAVNDGGTGAMHSLGARFYKGETEIPPSGLCGEECDRVDFSGVTPLLAQAEIIFACDVDNPFFGERGASLVYSPQKGADTDTALRMDKSHKKLWETILRCTGKDINIAGAGAAGGLSGGLLSICSPQIKSGYDVLCDVYKLEEKIKSADIIITGEGKTDEQTLNGKLPAKVSETAKKHGKTVYIVSGSITDGGRKLNADGFFPLVRGSVTTQMAMENPRKYLTEIGKEIKSEEIK